LTPDMLASQSKALITQMIT